MIDLAGRAALVTGAGGGIGRGIATVLAGAGAAVLVTDLDPAKANAVAEDLARAGHEAAGCKLDAREQADIEAALDTLAERFGRVDILVNNAGNTARQRFLEMELAFFREIIRLNLEGYFICAQAAARRMANAGRGGRIVNISSNSGIFGGVGRAAYAASKAGVIALTQTMASELAPHGILVNTVCPGPIRTELSTADAPTEAFTARMNLKRFGEPEEVGRAVAFLASDACTFTTGHILAVDGGLTVTGIQEG